MFTADEDRNKKPDIKKEKTKNCARLTWFVAAIYSFLSSVTLNAAVNSAGVLVFLSIVHDDGTAHDEIINCTVFRWRHRDWRNYKWYGLRILLNRIASDEKYYVLNVWTLIVYYCAQFVGSVVDAAGATHDKTTQATRGRRNVVMFFYSVCQHRHRAHTADWYNGNSEMANRAQTSARIRVFFLFIGWLQKTRTQPN